jgi:hypothetical protein
VGRDLLLRGEGRGGLSPWIALRLFALGESPCGHVVFHHVALFDLVPDGVSKVWVGRHEKILKLIGRLPRLAHEIKISGSDVFLLGVIRLLVVVIIVIACSNYALSGAHHFCPFLLPLALLLAPLPRALGGTPRLSPGTVFPSPWMKMAPTTSSF